MKKIIIVLGFIFCLISSVSVYATETSKLIHYYKNEGYYYYYMPSFNVSNFKKPDDLKPARDVLYNIFIYNKPIEAKKFLYSKSNKIEDTPGWMFDMTLVGINNNPQYYIKILLKSDNEEIEICQFKKNNKQIKYIKNPETGNFIKQLEFNNGKLNISSICNQNYIPNQDI